jgi:hypothetical protein
VVWVGGGGSNDQNPTSGEVLRYGSELDTTTSPRTLSATDLDCTAGLDFCGDSFRKK